MTVNIPNNDLTRIFLEHYAERVAIMSIDGGVDNAEESAYADTIKTLREKTGGSLESIPNLELCKASEQYL